MSNRSVALAQRSEEVLKLAYFGRALGGQRGAALKYISTLQTSIPTCSAMTTLLSKCGQPTLEPPGPPHHHASARTWHPHWSTACGHCDRRGLQKLLKGPPQLRLSVPQCHEGCRASCLADTAQPPSPPLDCPCIAVHLMTYYKLLTRVYVPHDQAPASS